jgi:hypothetical protein
MKTAEDRFIDIALDYKRQYDKCAWWRFKRRHDLFSLWQGALALAIRYAKQSRPEVIGSVCDNCTPVTGFYLGITCPKCNRPFRSIKQTDR